MPCRNVAMRCAKQPLEEEEKVSNGAPEQVKNTVNPRVEELKAANKPETDLFMTQQRIMRFDGAGPEVINGRLAMLGFVTAIAAELGSGLSLADQWKIAGPPVYQTMVLIWIASLMPLYAGVEKVRFGPFNLMNELINGRAAMVGFGLMSIYEFFAHKPMFNKIFNVATWEKVNLADLYGNTGEVLSKFA